MQQELLHALIQINLDWLEQAIQLLGSITDDEYATSPANLRPHRAGSHLRHILDFYDCLIGGLESGHVNYDARQRDERTAVDRTFAIARMRRIARAIESSACGFQQDVLMVMLEDAGQEMAFQPWMQSSLARELQMLSSHTVHHFALIAITLQAHGVSVPSRFGMAPSTLRYQSCLVAA